VAAQPDFGVTARLSPGPEAQRLEAQDPEAPAEAQAGSPRLCNMDARPERLAEIMDAVHRNVRKISRKYEGT